MAGEELTGFEREIIETYREVGKMAGWKGVWIRELMSAEGAGYVYGMYKRWKRFCGIAREREAEIKEGSYGSFRTYFYLLKKLGLVEEAYRLPGERGPERVYYMIAPGMEDHVGWTRAFQEVYPSTDWTELTPEERRELREEYAS